MDLDSDFENIFRHRLGRRPSSLVTLILADRGLMLKPLALLLQNVLQRGFDLFLDLFTNITLHVVDHSFAPMPVSPRAGGDYTGARSLRKPPSPPTIGPPPVLDALLKAFAQLKDKRTRRLVWWVLLISLAVALALIGITTGLLSALKLVGIGWLDDLVTALGGLAAAFVAWMLFPPLALLIAYIVTDPVAEHVEARYYPHLPPAHPQGLWQFTKAAIRFEIVSIVANLLILPLSVVPFVQVVYPVIYYGVNGLLFGREFMEIVAPRRLDFQATRALIRKHRLRLLIAGMIITFLFTVPVLNLLAPILATAFMVHVYHRIAGPAAAGLRGALPPSGVAAGR
jgi:uncharacterized protein involved in cysteine biosynthesis